MAYKILKAFSAFIETLNSKPKTDDMDTKDIKDKDMPAPDDVTTNKDTDKADDTAVTDNVDTPKDDNDKVDDSNKAANTDKTDDAPKNDDKKSDNALDNPEVRLKTSCDLPAGGYLLGFSIQGRSHIMMDTPCQDYHAFEDLGDGWYIAITSDGAGSAREAARGSKANCDIALRLIKQLLTKKKWKENNYLPTDKEWYIEIKNIFEVIQTIIIRNSSSMVDSYKAEQEAALSKIEEEYGSSDDEAKKHKLLRKIENLKESITKPLEARDFNATIIVMLLSPKGMMTAHIGDGRMGYLTKDGEWKSLITPHKGDEASSTVFVPNNWNRQLKVPEFTMSDVYLPETNVVPELPKAFVLMSDGCENFTWVCTVFDEKRNMYYDRNLPFDKFFNPLIDRMSEIKDKEERINEMIDIINLGTTGGKKELDDRTMILGVLGE